MAKQQHTHVNCGGPYPAGPGVMIRRGEPYAPSKAELTAEPRRWAPIDSRRARVAVPAKSPAGRAATTEEG